MSIKVMSRVWEESSQKGTPLLVLLALADWSNDRGECDPSYNQLADKARIDRRRAIRVVQSLEADGELSIRVGKGFRYSKDATSNQIILRRYAEPGGTQTTRASGTRATRVVAPRPLPPVAPVPPTTVNNNDQLLLSPATDASPLRGSSSSRSAKPAPPDHDDDAGQGSSAVDYPEASEALDAIVALLAANPCRNPEGRALIAWSAIRRAAPTATAADIRAAAADWAERWERIKGHAPDPLQASQLPDVVAAWMKSTTTASRAGHGLVPVIER